MFWGALEGQPQDAGLLELLQQTQRGLDPVAAGRRVPVEVLADRLRQFLRLRAGKVATIC